MRVVAVLFGLMFMVAGALGMIIAVTQVPGLPVASDGWTCSVNSGVEQCTTALNGPSQMVAESMWVDSALTIGAALFVSGAVLNAGAMAAGGRRA